MEKSKNQYNFQIMMKLNFYSNITINKNLLKHKIYSFLSTPINSISAAAKFTFDGIIDTPGITSLRIHSFIEHSLSINS